MNNGFASIVGLREVSIGPGDRLKPTYGSTKLNRKCNSRVDTSIEGSFVSLSKKLDLN